MKTLIRLLIVLPFLTLGGCYTQIAFRDYSPKDSRYESEEDEYAYEDQADSNYYDDNSYDNYYQGSYFPSYRRYLWNYYPSNHFSFGLGYYPYYYSLFVGVILIGIGDIIPFGIMDITGNYGYHYWGNNYSNWNNYTGSIVKYRNNVNTELEITTVNAVEQ